MFTDFWLEKCDLNPFPCITLKEKTWAAEFNRSFGKNGFSVYVYWLLIDSECKEDRTSLNVLLSDWRTIAPDNMDLLKR